MAGGIFTLDLSSTTGWCLAEPGCRPIWGVWFLPTIGGEGARFAALENEIGAALALHDPRTMVIEAPLPLPAFVHRKESGEDWQTSAASIRQQLGLRAIAYSEGYRASVKVVEVDVYTVRMEVLGTGRVPKGEAKMRVLQHCQRNGWAVTDHNAGDAIMLADWYSRKLGWRLSTGPRVAA